MHKPANECRPAHKSKCRGFGRRAIVGLVLLSAPMGPALAQTAAGEPGSFQIEAISGQTSEPSLAQPDGLLFSQPLSMVRMVKLGGSIEFKPRYSAKQTVSAGTTLFGIWTKKKGWVYCADSEEIQKAANIQIPCAADSDGDGKFDLVYYGLDLHVKDDPGDVIAPSYKGLLATEFVGRPRAIPIPVSFEALPPDVGPLMPYEVRWQPNRPPAKKGKPPAPIESISLYGIVGFMTASQVIDRVETIPLRPDGTAIGKYRGSEIEIQTVYPDGRLKYRIVKTMPSQTINILAPTLKSNYVILTFYH